MPKRLAAFFLLLLFCASFSSAGTLRLKWTRPGVDADSFDCMLDGSHPCTDYAGVQIWGWRFGDRDTIPFGFVTADSADFDIEDGTMGVLLFKTMDTNNNLSCIFTSYVFAIPATAPPVLADHGLLGSYYTGRNLDILSYTTVDSVINFRWTGPAWPGGPADNFSVRWTGNIAIPATGSWTFYLGYKEGLRMWIDNAVVYDHWPSGWADVQSTVSLTAGTHAIKVDFWTGTGDGIVYMQYAGPGVPKQIVPKSALSP